MAIQTLAVLPQQFNIHAMEPDEVIPQAVFNSDIYFIGKTGDQLSLVVPDTIEIDSADIDKNWRVLELIGPLQLSMVGIMAQIGQVLARAKVSIFIVSTFDTDFFLVKDNKLSVAVSALRQAGYTVNE